MFIIDVAVKADRIPAEDYENVFAQHREWFAKYFNEGKFLILGPYLDREHAGIIIAQAESRAEIDEIISHDVLYPGLADYRINEFKAAMCADNISAHAK